jgi:DNA-directed RNA polymerase subunit beta
MAAGDDLQLARTRMFGQIREVAECPTSSRCRKSSYDQFLMVKEPKAAADEGLQAVFKSVFPISDFSGTSMLEFVRYEFEAPKYDVDECRQRDMTYSAPLKVNAAADRVRYRRGNRRQVDQGHQGAGRLHGRHAAHDDNGTFIVNGTERVIVSQMHRSPGVFFDHDKGKTHASGKLLFAARIIPYRGSWLDIEFDAKDIVYARIDRRRKIPVTSLLMRSASIRRGNPRDLYYAIDAQADSKRGWRDAVRPPKHEGHEGDVVDLIDATGEVVCRGRQEDHGAPAKRDLAKRASKKLRLRRRGHVSASTWPKDIVNMKPANLSRSRRRARRRD